MVGEASDDVVMVACRRALNEKTSFQHRMLKRQIDQLPALVADTDLVQTHFDFIEVGGELRARDAAHEVVAGEIVTGVKIDTSDGEVGAVEIRADGLGDVDARSVFDDDLVDVFVPDAEGVGFAVLVKLSRHKVVALT